ncbi:MAG: HmuY family protein [Sediminibacterium sp.]
MKHNLNLFALILLLSVVFTSCSKKDDTTTIILTATQTKNVAADPAISGNHYTFFSLERNEMVAVSDSATAKWDIAFRSTNIIINGGISGSGAGGAFVQKATTFDNYKTIPADSVFKTDASTAFAVPAGSGNGWYNYDFIANIISPIPGNVLVVRTAGGKYAKVEILSYYKDAPASPAATDVTRYFTFRFVYQPNGTKTF